jgi:predicted N-acyltransferase
VLAGLPRKARAAARNARDRHKLTVEFADANLRQVWRLYARSMRRLGSPNYPYRFFEALVHGTPERHVVSLVRHEGRPAAGLVSFIHNDTLMPYFAGCDERLERYSPNNFLYLTAMEWGVRAGLRRFDFGRSRVGNQGSFNFKRHQGFEPEPLRYQVWVRPGKQAASLTPDSSRLQWAIRTWRRLPLMITRPLGARLAGWVPG